MYITFLRCKHSFNCNLHTHTHTYKLKEIHDSVDRIYMRITSFQSLTHVSHHVDHTTTKLNYPPWQLSGVHIKIVEFLIREFIPAK